jgi:hypothetical protein
MREVLIGQTDYTVLVKIIGTDGAPESGLTEASIDLAYSRVETDNDVTTADVTPAALSALTDAHTDWGFEEVSSTDHPGLYRLDIADAVFASGAWEAVVTITDASGTDFYAVDIGFRLVAFNPLDGVRLGLTALPNAAADAAGGLPISDAGGLDLDAKIGALTFTVANKVDANATHISGDSVAADNAEAFFDGTGYAGTNNVIPTVTTLTGHTPQTGDSYARLGAPAGASVSADIAAIEAQTDDIGAAGAGLTALATQASVNAVDDFLDTEIAAIKAVTDALTAAAAAKLALSAGSIVTGTVDDTGFSPTTTEFEADDITTAAADHYNGRIIIFTSGTLQYQATSITDYSLATGRGHFTVPALTSAPGNNVSFLII